jgi:hypothetical protein
MDSRHWQTVGSKQLAVANNLKLNMQKEANILLFRFERNILKQKTRTEVIYLLQSEYFEANISD